MQFLNDLPHFEVVRLHTANLIIVLLLGYLVAFFLWCLFFGISEPFRRQHAANILLELEDDLLDLDPHVLLLDALQLRH